MKNKLLLALFAATTALRLAAETLSGDTAVFVQTDAKSPILARLKAGATVTSAGEAPVGWMRVEVPGPFEAYVNNRDITKGLEVREGANIHAAPRKDAPVLTVASAGDKTELIGLANDDWAQIKLDRPLQGFIAVGETANRPAAASKPAPKAAPQAPAPVLLPPPSTAPVTTVGRPAPTSGTNAELPRVFSGRFVVARRIIVNPNPPYDYQLTDSNGRRFAYVDTKRLLLTDKIEAYIDRSISVTGTLRNTVDGKDLVIAAESMKLN